MGKRCALTAYAVACALLALSALTSVCAAEPVAPDSPQPTTELTVTLEPNAPEPTPILAAADTVPCVGSGVCDLASQLLGTPYRWGGTTPNAFDCSGFVRYCYAKIGVSLPRTARQQYKTGVKVAGSALQAGDLIFFDMMKGYVSHVGMYIGDRRFIHASTPSTGVRIDCIDSPKYRKHLVGARRYTS